MKELDADDVVRMVLEKQETCSMRDISEFKEKYEKEHPDTYVCIYRDNVEYVKQAYRTEFYWDEKRGVFIKQESIICPCCGVKHYKYPDTAKFNIIFQQQV